MSRARSKPVAGLMPESLTGGTSKGRELRRLLEELVGTLEPGSLLPSERVLASRFGVARQTVRGELERMSAEGFTYRVQGSGTFVADRTVSVAQAAAVASFSDEMRSRGMRPGAEVLSNSVVPAIGVIARQLKIPVDAPIVQIDRVRTGDDIPMALERAYLPADRFPGLEDEDLTDTSLYEVLETRWGVQLREADQRIVAVLLDDFHARLLELGAGDAALRFRTTGLDELGNVVHYTDAVYRGDRYEAHLHQNRGA
ncbi:GntR family transcriptional regulator [Kribbella solani]|uniref:GntR family transcriptional regulator n=1 Tax=Kribbella solani TaxID=236067 RepID=UPI0029A13A6C|nr:GntR family transcriptional regulator [Kribbella solani]MDX2968881.1 GntR family transcriptional regulator [Kribbella solani]MDX3002679.1 GntR family transcriptional regulator [Kribbella solani]